MRRNPKTRVRSCPSLTGSGRSCPYLATPATSYTIPIPHHRRPTGSPPVGLRRGAPRAPLASRAAAVPCAGHSKGAAPMPFPTTTPHIPAESATAFPPPAIRIFTPGRIGNRFLHCRIRISSSGRIGNRPCRTATDLQVTRRARAGLSRPRFDTSGRIGNRIAASGRIGNRISISGRIGNPKLLSPHERGVGGEGPCHRAILPASDPIA